MGRNRIDYERMPPQKPVPNSFPVIEAKAIMPFENRQDGFAGVVLHVEGIDFAIGYAFETKEHMDKVIQAMIQARNNIWPTP